VSGLDDLVSLIDNGGTRSCWERRRGLLLPKIPDRRSREDRRSGTDRRRVLNRKRGKGAERRIVFKE
jgi:hypothetical protein